MTNRFQVDITALDKFTPTFDALNKQAQKSTDNLAKQSVESKRWLGNMAGGLAQTQKQLQVPTSSIDALLTLATPTTLMAGIGAALGGLFAVTKGTGEYAAEVDHASRVLGINTDKLQEWRAAARLAGSTAESMTSTFSSLGGTLQDVRYGRNPTAAMVLRGMGIKTAVNDDGSINVESTAQRIGAAMSGMDALTRRTFGGVLGIGADGAALLARGDMGTLRTMAGNAGAVLNRQRLDQAILSDRGYTLDAMRLEALGRAAGSSDLNPLSNLGRRRAEMGAADATEAKKTDDELKREADALRGRFKPMSGAGTSDAAPAARVDLYVTAPKGSKVTAHSTGPGVRIRHTGPVQ